MKNKVKHYTLDNILLQNADYNVIYGERSNGKTTAVLHYGLEDYVKSGFKNQLAIIRRWDEDFKGKTGAQMCDNLVSLGWVEDLTDGIYNGIYYYARKWYLCYYNDKNEKTRQDVNPFAQGFAISAQEHYKSSQYPMIQNILFDEFITRKFYLPDEFIEFQNLLSTLIRLKDNVKIFMCGNSVNKYCPYFNEMGLSNVRNQRMGTIDVYTYGEGTLKVAVEYSDMPSGKKPSNKYFAFNNPKLKMITEGAWEIDIYPHLPEKFRPKDNLYKFYIEFDTEIIQGNVIAIEDKIFLFFHRKTTPIEKDNEQLVYSLTPNYRRNYSTNILKPINDVQMKIYELLKTDKAFYQDNEVGEVVNNYLKCCLKR